MIVDLPGHRMVNTTAATTPALHGVRRAAAERFLDNPSVARESPPNGSAAGRHVALFSATGIDLGQ